MVGCAVAVWAVVAVVGVYVPLVGDCAPPLVGAPALSLHGRVLDTDGAAAAACYLTAAPVPTALRNAIVAAAV